MWMGSLLSLAPVSAAEEERFQFSIPKGEATQSLMLAAAQAEVDIMFVSKTTNGVATRSVDGEHSLSEALDLLLQDTPLVAIRDSSGAYAVIEPTREGGNVQTRPDNLSSTQDNELPTNQEKPMKEKKQNIGALFKGLLSLAVSSSPNLSAQDDPDNEVFELSPFTVDGSEDTGYRATSTLAGTRIKTNLKDLGSAISVITEEFMDDTAATDASTLLSYTTNTEVGGYQGNFSGASNAGDDRYYQTNERTNPQFNQRIRGLGSADLTRGFFLSDIPFDSYNTNRVTVSRGPNSLLFGIGSPGGVINNNTKQAFQNSNFGEAKVRIDNYGSLRTELDINRSIIDGRLALRIAGLRDDLKYKQDPAHNLDERLYGALDFVLSKNENSSVLDATKLRINGEVGSSSGSPVEVIPPTVAYHGWFEPIPSNIQQYSGIAPGSTVVSPSEGGSWEFQETYNPYVTSSEGGINTNVHPSIFRHLGVVYNQADATTADMGSGDGLQGFTGLIPWNAGRGDTVERAGLLGTPALGDTPGDTSLSTARDYHTNSPYSEPYAIGFATPTLQNREIFDYRNLVYSGGIDRIDRDFDAINFALEQSFFNNKLAFELAYDKQHYETHQDFFFAGGNGTSTTGPYDIYVAISEYMLNGQPNPNLGRAYTRVARPEIRFSESDRETFRFTGFGEIDFSDKDSWAKHLGRHRFTGLYNDYTRDTHSMNWREAWGSNDIDIGAAVAGTTINHFRRVTNTLVYTSDPLLGLSSLDDVRLNQIQIKRPQPGDEYNVFFADVSNNAAPRTIDSGNVFVERYLNNENVGRSEIEAKAAAWQSYFLDGHIVGLMGYREDDTKNYSRAPIAEVREIEGDETYSDRIIDGRYNPDFARLSRTPGLEESGDTFTWSVVGRYPESLLGELPAGMDLQVHYAESENFNPIGLRNNALGEAIGQPSGTTKEQGFLVSFGEGKYSLKANWFETSLNDVNAIPRVNVAGEAIGRINGYRAAELDGQPFSWQTQTVEGDPDAFPIQDYETFYTTVESMIPDRLHSIINPRREDTDGDGIWDRMEFDAIPVLRSTQNRISEGFEIEMVASPTPNLRLLANISKQEAVQSDTATVMTNLVEDYNRNLQSTRVGEMNRSPDGTVIVRQINEIWLVNGVAPVRAAKALDNTLSNELREWRFTGVANYTFSEGRFNGFSVGGAARWEDEAATGYLFELEEETGVPVPNVDHPYYDDALFSGDLWLGYARKIKNDSVDWKVQLNIRNAFGDDNDIPVKTNPDGQVAVIRIPNPRTIYLTNSFKF